LSRATHDGSPVEFDADLWLQSSQSHGRGRDVAALALFGFLKKLRRGCIRVAAFAIVQPNYRARFYFKRGVTRVGAMYFF